MKYNLRFLTLIVSLSYSSVAHAGADPVSAQCIEQYVAATKALTHYSTVIAKKEWDLKGGLVHDEKLQATISRPKNYVQLKYLNSGDTGIRNNGMKVEYNGSETLKIKLGSTNFLGFFAHTAASAVIGDSMNMFDSKALEDEIFTINRTGFDFLAMILDKGLHSVKGSADGGFSLVEPGTCHLKYLPHHTGKWEVNIQPTDSIFDLEEKYATVAYIIFQSNKTQFSSLRDVFVRKKPMKVSIPIGFFETDVVFNPTNHLADQFRIYQDGRLIGEYHFTEFKSLTPQQLEENRIK